MFNRAVEAVLKCEGGVVNDPHDPGGFTAFGISQAAYPHLDISKLTEADARAIYYRDYWIANKCDKMPYAVALCVFDAAVNMGNKRSALILQEVLRVELDSIIGPNTLSKLTNDNAEIIAMQFTALRVYRYSHLSGWERYGLGWTRRALDIYKTATEGIKV